MPYVWTIANFNPLRPRGRRLYRAAVDIKLNKFQPTPPARTETDLAGRALEHFKISTHSAREDGDNVTLIQWEL